jgi:hypothetical protein
MPLDSGYQAPEIKTYAGNARFAYDISLKEKMIEKPMRIKVKPEYEDIPEFEVLVYSPNEILVEKLRSILQRGKARDYYDVWRLMKEKEFNPDKIRELFILKCQITGIEFYPALIFDENRLSEAKKFWTIALARLTKNLPDFESVVKDLRPDINNLLQELKRDGKVIHIGTRISGYWTLK